MITQKIIARTDSLKLDKIISRYGEDSMRQVVFIIVRPDPDSEELIPITIPEDAVGSFRILKPSGNFVIVPMSKSVLSTGETAFDVVLPASVNTAKGSGYYDIRITSDTDKYYFTAQGDFLIDDNIISDEVLEDVSEVNGLVFPDDFLTTDEHFAELDDDITGTESTWSSSKISNEIEDAISSIPSPLHEYSTAEKVVGKWTDGRNVYERTVSVTLASSTAYTVVLLASVSNIDNVWLYDAFGIHTVNGVIYSSPIGDYKANPTEVDIGGYLSYNNVNISFEYRCGSFLWNGTGIFTIRYTKDE